MGLEYLGIKWVALQLILALELPCVSLVHCQPVFSSLEVFSLINFLNSARFWILLFSADCNSCCPFPVFPQLCDLFLVSVVIDYEWQPDCLDVLNCESIKGIKDSEVIGDWRKCPICKESDRYKLFMSYWRTPDEQISRFHSWLPLIWSCLGLLIGPFPKLQTFSELQVK